MGAVILALALLGVAVLAIALTHRPPPALPRDVAPHACPHRWPDGRQDPLCARYGCPDDPEWIGDRR